MHLGASELMRTRIKVRIRPLAPNRTVHLGASERLTVCVAQPGNGYTSARIAAKTFRLQLSYTKIKSGLWGLLFKGVVRSQRDLGR